MAIPSAIWSILSTYRPNAANNNANGGSGTARGRPTRFGVFEAKYVPPRGGIARPRNDKEAQALYNHVRTVAFWLDASPLLSDLGLPFRAGLDDIISLVPLYGDVLSGVLQLYQVYLCFIFGVPYQLLGWMVLNVLLDIVAGIVPIIGDVIDNWFKSNLRNLALLETWLLTDPFATRRYHILLMPESDDFIPTAKSRWGSWFKGGVPADELDARRRERTTGKVRKTRRMSREEGVQVPVQEGLD